MNLVGVRVDRKYDINYSYKAGGYQEWVCLNWSILPNTLIRFVSFRCSEIHYGKTSWPNGG